ncbi:MAG: PQQ-binding-like beta-propeller repeat protein, partial [Clostridium sp.]
MKKLFSRASILIVTLIMISSLQGCTKEAKEEAVKKDVLWSFKAGGSIQSSPVIFENDIIFGSNDKKIYSVDLSTQEEKWKFESDGLVNSTPIIDENNLVVVSQTTCYLLDAKTGKEIWKYEGGGDGAQIDIYDYHSASPIIYKDLVIFTSKSGTIYGLNKADGKVKWQYTGEGTSEVRTTPSIQDNIMVFVDIKGNCYAMDLETQKTIWTKSIGVDYIHEAFSYNGYAYFMGRDCKLVAFDIKDGTEKWSYNDSVGSWLTAEIIVKDDMLYVGGSDNFKVLTFK